MTKGIQIAIGATAIAGLLGWYGASNLEPAPAFTHFKSTEELQANPAARGAARPPHPGSAAPPSICLAIETLQARFQVQNTPAHLGSGSGPPLDVVLASLETPDLFKDGAEVVVEGRMVASDGGPVFEADKILAKCPSKFEAAPTDSAES